MQPKTGYDNVPARTVYRIVSVIRSVSIVASLYVVASCEMTTKVEQRQSRPSNEGETVTGYLDSIEKDIATESATEVTIGRTKVTVPANATRSGLRVRLSHRASAEILTEEESQFLGNPHSDIVEIEVFDAESSRIVGSDELTQPILFSQEFDSSSDKSNLGFFVVTDPGTSSQVRSLIASSEIDFDDSRTLNLAKTSLVASFSAQMSFASIALVTYRTEALEILNIKHPSELRSTGGNSVKKILTQRNRNQLVASIKVESDAAFTRLTTVRLQMSSEDASEMYITPTAGCSSDGVWQSFSETLDWTLGRANQVVRIYAKFRDGTRESACVSASIIHDDIAPSEPADFADGSNSPSLIESPLLTWSAAVDSGAGVSHYEIAIGSSHGGTDVTDWTAVGNQLSKIIKDLNLSNGSTYFASLRAVDLAGNRSQPITGDGWSVNTSVGLNCPNNYVKVQADEILAVPEFCVMKYEARILNNDYGQSMYNASFEADSRATGTPWTNLTRDQARSECAALGSRFKLISNAQWTALARQIEDAQGPVGSYLNWSNQSKSGQNYVNRGISNAATYLTCDSQVEYVGANCAASDPQTPFAFKRTHTLPSGEIIWDLAGNAREWVDDDSTFDYGNPGYFFQISSTHGNACLTASGCNGPQGKMKAAFGPSGDYSFKNGNEEQGFGLGDAELFYTAGTLVRGGTAFQQAGIFTVSSSLNPSSTQGDLSFRCVYMAE